MSKILESMELARCAAAALEAMGASVVGVNIFCFGPAVVEIAPPKLGLAAALRDHGKPLTDLYQPDDRWRYGVEAFGVRVQWEVARDKAAAPEYSGEAA